MNKLIKFVRQHWLYFVPILLLLVFVGSIIDRNYYFGGDLILPINPQNSILRSIFMWEDQNGGSTFFKYVLIVWQGFFYVFSLFQIPIDIVIKIFITTIYILGFIFSYLLYRTLFKETKWGTKKFALLFALFFFLNPAAILVVVGTWELYAVPICAYFLVKYLDTKNILYIIPFAFFLNISFFPGLPQAKPLIVFMIAILFILIIYSLLRNIKIKSLILPVILLGIFTFLLNAFVTVPFMSDAFGNRSFYKQYTTSVITYNGDADLYSAGIPFTTRFYNSNLVDKYSSLGNFLANPFFISWTFFVLFLALLSVFLIKDKKEKHLVYICLFAFLIFIFIAKGANPPFGEIYRWSLSHIPIAKLFRTTSTSIIGAVIFYTLLVTISVYFISRKWKPVLPIIVILNVLMLHGIYLGFKLDNPYQINQKGIPIPNDYFKMGNRLDNLKKDGKVLLLPLNDGYVSKEWAYTGQSLMPWLTKKPIISRELGTISNLDIRTSNELCSFTSLYNIRYLLQEKDFRDKELSRDTNYKSKKLMENNYFKLQEINESCFLPHFYNSEKTMYFKGPIQNIYALSYLPVYEKNSIIFTPENLIINKQDEKELINKFNNFVIEISPNNIDPNFLGKAYVYSILGEDHLIGDIIYPYVSKNPISFIYPLVLWKEDKALNNQKLSKRQLLDLQLFYASKRIKEIERWGINSNPGQNSQKRFKKLMEGAIETAVASEDRRVQIELVYEYILGFQKKIRELRKNFPYWDRKKLQSWIDLLESLETETERRFQVPDFDNLAYNVFIPSLGDYKGYLVLDNGRPLGDNIADLQVSLNGAQLATYSAKEIINKNTLDLGTFNVQVQNNKITVQIGNKQNLIDSSQWDSVEPMQSVVADSNGILFSRNLKLQPWVGSRNPIVYQEIKKWIPGATYMLRIRHKEEDGATFHLRIREKKHIYDKNNDSWYTDEWNIIDSNVSPKVKGDEFKLLITADKNATGASIYLSGLNGMVKIESVKLERIIIPNIYFIKEKNNYKTIINQQPTVNFTKINPTKYKLTISNMTNPSFIVFSETFDKGWKMYKKDPNYIPETQHFLANGYANAWYITPQDSESQKQSEFIVEYIPQRLFYIGLIISLVTLFICICIYIYSKIRGIISK